MVTGNKIAVNGENYEVKDKLGSGGQGAVWKIKRLSDKKEFALKLIEEQDTNKKLNKITNINRLVNDKVNEKLLLLGESDGVNHVFPISRYRNGTEIGYVMKCVSGETLNKMLENGSLQSMKMEKKLLLCKKIARSIDLLHGSGWCYTDINWGNFIWNDKAETLYVIDCENVANTALINSGSCAFLIGTGFFIAPEVAFGKRLPGPNSDKYALASLIFRILTNNVLKSAYHGKAMYSAQPACQDMLEVCEFEKEDDIDKKWRVFVFDKADQSNGINDLCKKSKNPENVVFRKLLDEVIDIWNGLDDRLKNLFYDAFSDPFNEYKRPTASKWVRVIDSVLSNKTAKLQPKTAPYKAINANSNKVLVKKQKTYPPFIPCGKKEKTEINQPNINKPYLVASNGTVVEIKDEYLLTGKVVNLPQYNEIGKFSKTDSHYEFVSSMQCFVEILNKDGSVKARIKKGRTAILESGESLKPIVSSVSIKLVY